MAVFKCKMCGGTMEVDANATVAVCEYCHTRQTLPRISTDKKQMLYDRAEHFRSANDFDKAYSLYEQITIEDPDDAEAYWDLVLCTYGIEYVEDPASHTRVPTVNRTQLVPIFEDLNYQKAVSLADVLQKEVYEAEAKEIDRIQQGILAISRNEKPFDVFICYKEADADGRRTRDSVIAQDLYYGLQKAGYKVFFSRITLEQKAGTAYEPYIFAAIRSARVMVVLGTKPEYFKAAWVRNEWSRFLALMKKDSQKRLIPAYRDMDPYDLPEEFSYLQALDMSRLGFLQDIIAGIRKILGTNEAKGGGSSTGKTSSPVGEYPQNANYVERGMKALKIGRLDFAMQLFKRSMNEEVDNPWAYLGAFFVTYKQQGALRDQVATLDDLCGLPDSEIACNDDHDYYKNAVSLANADFKTRFLDKRAPMQKIKKDQYLADTIAKFEGTEDPEALQDLAEQLAHTHADRFPDGYSLSSLILQVKEKRLDIIGGNDGPTKDLVQQWWNLAQEFPEADGPKATLASTLVDYFEGAVGKMTTREQCAQTISDIHQYASWFPEGYDVSSLIHTCEEREKEFQLAAEYEKADSLFRKKLYSSAKEIFLSLGQYKDAPKRVQDCMDADNEQFYQSALKAQKERRYDYAIYRYSFIPNWKDSRERIAACKRGKVLQILLKGLALSPLVFAIGIFINSSIWCKALRGHWHPFSCYYYPHEFNWEMECTICGYSMSFEDAESALPDEQYYQLCVDRSKTDVRGLALAKLAQCYLTGKGTAVDYVAAYTAMSDGASKGSLEARELKERYEIRGTLRVENDLHWTVSHGPYYVSGNLWIPSGSTLFIDPGVQVIFVNRGRISLDRGARLHAVGTVGQPIGFQKIGELWDCGIFYEDRNDVDASYVTQSFDAGLPQYHIGEPGPAGGMVFYDAGSYEGKWRYLEADTEGSSHFAPFGYSRSADVALVTSADMGRGAENTDNLVDAMGNVAYLGAVGLRMTNSYAAKVAKEDTTDSFDDWFLPSIAELEHMNDVDALKPFIQGARLWSSSESSQTEAWALVDGKRQSVPRNEFLRVLPIRIF